jgi:hypothetical protein
MPDQSLTIPQHADPIARGLLFVLLAAVLGLALAMPAPPSEASTPVVIFATPALATPALAAWQDASRAAMPTPTLAPLPTEAPTEAPAASANVPTVAPTLEAPAPETAVSEQASTLAAGASPEAAPVETTSEQSLIALGPQVPEGPQQVHQQPDSTYITVGDSPLRYYVDPDGQVTEVRLPGVDTAANGADIAAIVRATVVPTAENVVTPPSNPRGYLPRVGYRPKKP